EAAVDLAGLEPREVVGEIDGPGALEMSQPLAAERQQLLGEGVVGDDTVADLDDGLHLFAPLVVGYADRRDVSYRGVLEQHRVDLSWVDVHPSGDDQLRAASREEQVVLVVCVTHFRTEER